MTDVSTFHGLDSWLEELKKHGPNNLSMCIAGNKKDLKDEWKITEEQL
jgi:Ras family